MRKLIKWLLAGAGIILLLLIIVIVVALLVIDPNAYRARAEALVEEHTGRELRIGGDVELTFFPWLGIELDDMALGNAAGFGPEPFARLERAVVRVAVLPLLRGEVQADTVVVHGLNLHLARAADGRTNWDDLTAAEAPGPQEEPSSGQALAGLAIGGLDVRDARVEWQDAMAGQQWLLSGLDLESGRIAPGEAVPLDLNTRFSSNAPKLEGAVTLRARLTAEPDAERYQVHDLRLQTNVDGENLPGEGLSAVLALAGLTAELREETVAVQGLQLETGDLVLRAEGQARGVLSEPSVDVALSSNEFVPRQVLESLGVALPEMADASALGKARVASKIAATPTAATLGDLDVRLDDSRLTGTITLTDFAAPGVRFALALDALDLDRYLPAPGEEAAPPAAEAPTAPGGTARGGASPGAAAAAGAGQLPLETLRALDLEGGIDIGRLQAMGLESRDIHLSARAEGGRVRLHPLRAALYEGRYAGDVRLDFTGATPGISMDESLSGVQIGPLLQDLQGKDLVRGTAELSAKLTAQGLEPDAVRKTLNGEAKFSVEDGALTGVNIAQLIREAYARYRGQPVPKEEGPRETDFTSLSGSASIVNGLVTNRDLAAASPLLRVDGRGEVNLVSERIDYVADIVLVKSLEGQQGRELEALKGLLIPLQIKGTLSDPGFQLDVDRVLREKAKSVIKEKESELKQRLEQEKKERGDELKQELEKELQDGLKNLFGR